MEFQNYQVIKVPKFVIHTCNVEWSKWQTQKYKEWVLGNYSKRAEYLLNYLKQTEYGMDICGKENDSEIFISIWSWFRANCRIEKRNSFCILMDKIEKG